MNQVAQRFYDNMSGQLPSYGDISVTDPANFSFSACGDSHIGAPGGNVMKRAFETSKADGDAFGIVAGDITNTGLGSEIQGYKAQVSEVGFNVLPAIGNHDIFFGGWENYKTTIGRSMYSMNAGNVHFVFLDTANGVFGEEQLNWLKSDLAATNKTIKVVVTHFPLYTGPFSSIYKLSSDEEATYFKMIMEDNRVSLVITGHYHGFVDKMIGSTRYIVTGGCNNILDPGESSHYVKIIFRSTEIQVVPKYL